MISGSGISDPLTLGREENFLNQQAPLRGPPPPPPAPQEGLTVGEGGDVIFLQLTRTFVFKSYVWFCTLFSPESGIIIWQRKSAWRIFLNLLAKDVVLSYTFFYTKWSISYHCKVIWLLTKTDKLIFKFSNFTPHPWKKEPIEKPIKFKYFFKNRIDLLFVVKEESIDMEWW